ncbi:MAG: metalloregulator ArsR/SmtB family transcription factor [Candidatus Omnitrophica bacterium]|nr:metalloregulator ArsR/SmtB family transcription factor [Candidatus Omnitrophota bacterium]
MAKNNKNAYPFEEAAEVMRSVAHPVRLAIISLLENKGSMNVRQIQDELGLKQSITSQHLSRMFGKGVLGKDKISNEVYYFIKKKEILKLMTCIRKCCNG